ncbi:MAG: hypothetical protein IT378_26785 [Sandaracinaceae bacterium]|nr:hypothetical protein [Sandaracinaceae bacterium]
MLITVLGAMSAAGWAGSAHAQASYPSAALSVAVVGGWDAPVLGGRDAVVPGGPNVALEGGALLRFDRATRLSIDLHAGFAPSADATAWDLALHGGLRLGVRSDFVSGVAELEVGYRREQFHSALLPDRDALRARAGLGASIHGGRLPTVELGFTPLALQVEHILAAELTLLAWSPRLWLALWL